MALGYAVQSVFEILGVVALVFAMIYEDKIAKWEKKMLRRIKKRLFGVKSNVIPFESIQNDGRAV